MVTSKKEEEEEDDDDDEEEEEEEQQQQQKEVHQRMTKRSFPPKKLAVLINDIGIAMKNMEYALFRGKFTRTVR